MNDVFIALMLAAGVGGWVYSKAARRTGNDTQRSAIIAGIAGFLAFLVMISALQLIPA